MRARGDLTLPHPWLTCRIPGFGMRLHDFSSSTTRCGSAFGFSGSHTWISSKDLDCLGFFKGHLFDPFVSFIVSLIF